MSQRGAQKAGFFNCRPQFAIDATADLLLLHGFLLALMIRITLAFLSTLFGTSSSFKPPWINGPGFTSSLVPKPRPKTVQWSLLIAWLYWVRCTGFRVDLGKLWPSSEQRKRTLARVMRRKRRSSRSIQGQKRKDCQTRRGDMAESWLLHSCLKILSMDDVASDSFCWFAGTRQLEFWLVACFGARCTLSCFCFHCDNYDLCSLNHLLSSAADSSKLDEKCLTAMNFIGAYIVILQHSTAGSSYPSNEASQEPHSYEIQVNISIVMISEYIDVERKNLSSISQFEGKFWVELMKFNEHGIPNHSCFRIECLKVSVSRCDPQ